MGIWNRLGNVIENYINDFSSDFVRQPASFKYRNSSDPDMDAAYEELDDYLNRKELRDTWEYAKKEASEPPPQELRADFDNLGVPFGADAETCKMAYKKLLKIHHPDRHAGHEGNFKKATIRSAKINAAWERIENWRNAPKDKERL